MTIIVYVVLLGVFSGALSKDIVDRHDEIRPEEQGDLFEGDIELTPEQRAIIEEARLDESVVGGRRKATSDLAKRWPNAEVPYVITSAPALEDINDAIAHWEAKTCIRFIPRTNQSDYVEFITSTTGGCSSHVGKIGGKQQIKIASWCKMGNVAHEIGHAIGFWHEQSRPDRDDFITVHTENIKEDKKNNFNKYTWAEIVTDNVPYDVGSIMHYSQYGFSKNGQPTITANNPADNDKLGQRDGLSAADIQLARFMYECQAGVVCPEGWNTHGLSCYKVINTPYSYQEAQNACEQEDVSSYVAVVNDAEENAFIDGIAPSWIWLGCNALGGNFLWTCPDESGKTYDASTGTASPADSYWNWDLNQPETNDEQCQVQYQGGEIIWHSWPCSSHFAVICELPACPDGWIHNAGSCYKVLDNAASYQNAQSACQQEYALSYVTVANDAEENAYIKGIASDYIWLGCNALEGNYLWTCPDGSGKTYDASTGTANPVDSYWNWDVNQPEANDEECQVQYRGGTIIWHSWPCDSYFRVVCEI